MHPLAFVVATENQLNGVRRKEETMGEKRMEALGLHLRMQLRLLVTLAYPVSGCH
jgi:hypothetical protein